jgi:hypothetical protein
MVNLEIHITENNKICSFFCKGNSYILKKFSNLFIGLTDWEKTQLFENLWYQEFRCKLTKSDENGYICITFENETDRFLFLLRIK